MYRYLYTIPVGCISSKFLIFYSSQVAENCWISRWNLFKLKYLKQQSSDVSMALITYFTEKSVNKITAVAVQKYYHIIITRDSFCISTDTGLVLSKHVTRHTLSSFNQIFKAAIKLIPNRCYNIGSNAEYIAEHLQSVKSQTRNPADTRLNQLSLLCYS